MIETHTLKKLSEKMLALGFKSPDLHVVLGSVLSLHLNKDVVLDEYQTLDQIFFSDIPGLSEATAPGHKGYFHYFKHKRTSKIVCFQVGRLHGYEGYDPKDAVKPVVMHALAGCKKFLITNASGSLQKKHRPGNVVVIKDHVNLTGKNPLYGPNPQFEGKVLGPRFLDLSEAYDLKGRKKLIKVLTKHKITHKEGTYLGLLGPSFETPAEVKLYSKWGMDAVGMSTVWETIVLKHLGADVVGLSLIMNMGCGLEKQKVFDHFKFEKAVEKDAKKIMKVIFHYANEEFS